MDYAETYDLPLLNYFFDNLDHLYKINYVFKPDMCKYNKN